MKSIKLINQNLSVLGMRNVESIYPEPQNNEYEGSVIFINQLEYRIRLAKRTPKKDGYFVVMWEKTDDKNKPFIYQESPEKLIISIIDGENKGQYIFPKSVLLQKGILQENNSKGKMAFRVYPDWVENLNRSAEKTQKWQKTYFINLSNSICTDKLFSLYFA